MAGTKLLAITLAVVPAAGSQRPDGSGSGDWTMIRSYLGTIDPAENPVRAKVYSKSQVPTLIFGEIFLQNRIEVQGPTGQVDFAWSDSKTFAGTVCDIVDVDGNGSKEFVISSPSSVRVVSYRSRKFSYRDRLGEGGDELFSVSYLDIIDLTNDGRPEFVTFGGGVTSKQSPTVYVWNEIEGFRKAATSLADTYEALYGRLRR